MCHIFKIRPPGRKGWNLHSKYTSRKNLILALRELKSETKQVMPVRAGGLGAKFPYEIYERQR